MGKKIGLLCLLALVVLVAVFTVAQAREAPLHKTESNTQEEDNRIDEIFSALVEKAVALDEREGIMRENATQENGDIDLTRAEFTEERAAIDRERRDLTHEWVAFFMEFGWERYNGFLYADITQVIESTQRSIYILGDFIYWNETGKRWTISAEEQDAFGALFEDRLRIEQEFLERLQRIQRTGAPYDIRALSGEREFLYFLHESQRELGSLLVD